MSSIVSVLGLILSLFSEIISLPMPGLSDTAVETTYGSFFLSVWFCLFLGWIVSYIIRGDISDRLS